MKQLFWYGWFNWRPLRLYASSSKLKQRSSSRILSETFRASTKHVDFKRQSAVKADRWCMDWITKKVKDSTKRTVGGAFERTAAGKGLQNLWLTYLQVTQWLIQLYDGLYHDVDSSELLKIAVNLPKEAINQHNHFHPELMMLVQSLFQKKTFGDVMGHVTARRGWMVWSTVTNWVQSYKPLAEMFHATVLRSQTKDVGTFMMVWSSRRCTCQYKNIKTRWRLIVSICEGSLVALLSLW